MRDREHRAERRAGDRAIVIGGSIAGLLAARVLSDHFREVLVVERDQLPEGPEWRRKTPQSIHSHVLCARGYRIVTRLFPGLDDDLAQRGAPRFDYLGDCAMVADRFAPRFRSGMISRSCSRMLLEWAMRRHVLTLDNVSIAHGYRVTGLRASQAGTRVVGVIGNDGHEEADLIVDASGIGSRTPRWLAALGRAAPRERAVDLRGATVTRVFRLDHGAPDWVALFVRMTDDNPRQGSIARIEDGLWRVSMSGLGGCYPPRCTERFIEFSRALPHPGLGEIIARAEPVSPVYYYGSSRSRWLLYHETRMPAGLVVLGDAVFHPNAEHGQGMTFCALAAAMLHDALARTRGRVTETRGFSSAFQTRLARSHAPFWTWNTGAEMTIPRIAGTPPSRRERALQRYYRRVRRLAFSDPMLLDAAIRVTQAERHPSTLFHPRILARVVA